MPFEDCTLSGQFGQDVNIGPVSSNNSAATLQRPDKMLAMPFREIWS
jgi:hypothetical protein